MVSSFQQAVRSRFQEFRNDRRNANTLIFKMGGYKNIMCIEARANRKWLLLFALPAWLPGALPLLNAAYRLSVGGGGVSRLLAPPFKSPDNSCCSLIPDESHKSFWLQYPKYSVMHYCNCNSLGGHKRRTSYNSLDYFLKVYSFVLVKERNSSQTSFYVFLL